jgi:hypothetical protein
MLNGARFDIRIIEIRSRRSMLLAAPQLDGFAAPLSLSRMHAHAILD